MYLMIQNIDIYIFHSLRIGLVSEKDVYVVSHFSHVQLYVTLWTGAPWAPLSMGFSRQEYWSKLPCPPPRDFPHPGIKPTSLMSPALASKLFTTSANWEAHYKVYISK